MRNNQVVTMKTSLSQDIVGEFIGKGCKIINDLKKYLNIDHIDWANDYHNGRGIILEISGYPTNVYNAITTIKYKYNNILKGEVLLARCFKVEDGKIIVDLPKGQKGIVNNALSIVNNKIKTARINVCGNSPFYGKNNVEIQVLDIIMQEEVNELSDKKEKDFFNVDVLPQINLKTNIDYKQIPHFFGTQGKNINFLQDKYNVILFINSNEIEIIGSEICVNEAKKEIDIIYKNTIFEAEIIGLGSGFISVLLLNGIKKEIFMDYNSEKYKKGTKVKVIIYHKGLYYEKVELLEVIENKS